jgi:hypothetical protein
VTSKFRNKTIVRNPSVKNQDSLSAHEPIPISNKYDRLSSLQDPMVNANNTTVPKEQSLLSESQIINNQAEAISNRTNCTHHIPTILNGVINYNMRQADKFSVCGLKNNVNNRKRSRTKQSSKVVILSDSHLKGCTVMINNYLGDRFRVTGWTKSGSTADETVNKPLMDIVNLNKEDVIVISAVQMMCTGTTLKWPYRR